MPTRRKNKKKTRRTNARTLSRGVTSPSPIGPELMAVITNLIALMRATTDPRQLKKLDAQRIALSDEAARLIDGVLEDTTGQYRVAVEGLQQASETIRKAIQGVETVKEVIVQAARAAELVGKVAAMA
ncbi:MAG: hypothetical protein QM706_04625 [Nitrospira sp.]